jgi:hypothetical protein
MKKGTTIVILVVQTAEFVILLVLIINAPHLGAGR